MPNEVDEIGAPPLCPHCATVVRNLAERDHVGDRESDRVAAQLARQCPACRRTS